MNSVKLFFNGNLKEIVSPLFGINYWIGFSFCFLVITSLFLFRKFYAKVSKFDGFRYSLGSFQFLIYILYFTFHQLSGTITWKDYMPFQLCSVLNLTSAFLLIYPSEKLFSLTFLLVGPIILAFFLPDASKRVYGLNNFFFYQYYLNHLIIFFGYFYLYLYNHVKYDNLILNQSCIFITTFALCVFPFNTIFGTNYLFIGYDGFSFSAKYWILNTGNWNPILRFLFVWFMGLGFVLLFNFLVTKYVPPFYFDCGTKVNPYYHNKLSLFSKIKKKFKKNLKTSSNF
ncbi:MAG: hypothetical protein ACRC8P_03380 [Spiroplasma sp.]